MSRRSTADSLRSTNSKIASAPGKGVDLDGRVDREAEQIAVAVMHGDQRHARHEKREGEAKIAVVVEARDQHRDEQRRSMRPKRVGRI